MSEAQKPRDSNDQRMLIAITLCMGVFFVWSQFFAPKPEDEPLPTEATTAPADVPAVAPGPAALPAVVSSTGAPCTDLRQAFATTTFTLQVSDCGAARAVDLPDVPAPVTVTPWWTWVYQKGGSLFGGKAPGPWTPYQRTADHESLLTPNGAFLAAGRGDLVASTALAELGGTAGNITWRRSEPGLVTTGTLSPGTDPDLATLTVTWTADRPLAGPFWVSMQDGMAPISSTYDMHPRLEAGVAGKLDALTAPQDLKAARDVAVGRADWFGVGDRYFLAAAIAGADTPGSVKYAPLPGVTEEETTAGRHRVGLFFVSDTQELAAGTPLVANFRVYVGPKKYERLSAIGGGLDSAVSLGFFGFFARIILFTLQLFRSVIPSWGLSIIALTFLVRASLYPLAAKAFRSGKAMQAVQPQIKALQELYPDDKEKQSAETMRIFKEHGVNPLGGCLPMVFQIPVFFALVAGLNASPDLYGAHFLYLQDLSMQDPYGGLAVLIICGMYVQQQFMPTTGMDPNQAQMLKFMPLVFGFLMFSYPSGLSVYYVINTSLSILQQWYNTRGRVPTPSVPVA